MDKKDTVKNWLDQFCSFKATEWALLPDIELYMDQVTSYLRRQLALQEKDEKNPIITSNMINNYAKGGHIERSKEKRYNKEQLASLYMLCSMKQALSINDASLLLSSLKEPRTTEELYTEFLAIQGEVTKRFENLSINDAEKDEMLKIALSLSLSSVAERLIAERIISLFYPEEPNTEKEEKKTEKKSEKEKDKKSEKKAKEESEKEKKKAKEEEKKSEKKAEKKSEKDKEKSKKKSEKE
jgi:hypothetical protein